MRAIRTLARSVVDRVQLVFSLTILGALMWAPTAAACKYTVRDVAFVTLHEQPYRFFIYAGDGSSALPPADALAAARPGLGDSNVVPEVIEGAAAPDSAAAQTAEVLELDQRPAIALAAPDGRAIRLSDSGVDALDAGSITEASRRITSSGKQLELRMLLLAGHHSVIVLHEGASEEHNADARRTAKSLIDEVEQALPSLPKPIHLPPALMTISQDDTQGERLFLWSLGIDDEEVEKTQLAIVFGRCRLLGPPMPIPGTNRQQILRRLAVVGQDCECELDRSVMRGQMIPHAWSSREEALAASMLGFDPGNPLVQVEIQRILSRGPIGGSSATMDDDLAIDDLSLGGLQIIDIDTIGEPEPEPEEVEAAATAQATAAKPNPTPAPEAAPSAPNPPAVGVAEVEAKPTPESVEPLAPTAAGRPLARTLLWLVGGVAAVGLLGVLLILARGNAS